MDGPEARAGGFRRVAVSLLCAAALAVLGIQLWRLRSEGQALGLLRAEQASLLASRAASEKHLADALAAQRRAAGDAEALDLSHYPEAVRTWVARLEDPKLFQASQYRRRLDVYYAALFRLLRLPPAKLDALRDLLAERFKAEEEALRLAPVEGIFLDDLPERGALVNTGTGETDQQIRELLGGDAYETFVQYQGSIQTRNYAIAPFAAHEKSGPGALTDSQVDALTAAVPPYYFGVGHFVLQEPAPPLPPSLDEAAAAVLSESQLAAYSNFKAYWQAKAAQAAANQEGVAQQLAAKGPNGH
ncbi:MAG TPA: hypothetical protein VGG37_07710 [Opitutaceae bacterium]|jgi:hypothetical protein